MKTLLFATGFAVLIAGACNSTRDGVSSTNGTTGRNESTTTTTDRGTMPADRDMRTGTTTAPAERTTDANRTTTGSNMQNSDMRNSDSRSTDMRNSDMKPEGDMRSTDPNARMGTDSRTGMNSSTNGTDARTSGTDTRTGMSSDKQAMGSSTGGSMSSADLTNPNKVVETATSYGGLTKIPANVATQVIDGYISKLSAMPNTGALVTDLRMVKTQLNSANIDGAKVGEALTRLGMQTQALASGDAAYKSLGMALEQSGKMLTGK